MGVQIGDVLLCRLRVRTKEADASGASARGMLEEKAAEIRVLLAQLQQAQKEGQACKVYLGLFQDSARPVTSSCPPGCNTVQKVLWHQQQHLSVCQDWT